MKIEIVTIFPSFFSSPFEFGMIRQAIRKGLIQVNTVDLRDFAYDRHRTVDDRPYGGGEGMVLKPEPVFRAVEAIESAGEGDSHKILLTPRGSKFDQNKAKELSLKTRLVLICGRYEGVDQRVAEGLVDEELSVGDYVLSGGELAAAVIVEAVTRLIPGVLGEGESVLRESFMEDGLDFPQYTRPPEFRGMKVPAVLLSGNHDQIEDWRKRKALEATRRHRPDLLGPEKEIEDESR